MTSEGFEAPDLGKFLAHAYPDASPELIAALLSGARLPEEIWRRPQPQLHPVPETTRGYRIRLDLRHTKPPVWRRLDLPGDLTLPHLHEVIQAVMGWTDSHLHRFRTGNGRNAPEFLTPFDVEEGDEGMLEDDVRLDQVVAAEGDRLWYDYNFGDDWEHVLRVERVLDVPPDAPRCLAGKGACPPEDCGGVWGYHELAEWVRGDYADALRPEVFDSTAEAHAWLPESWHPDEFDLDEANEMIETVAAEPGPLTDELASLLEASQKSGSRMLRDLLAHPASHGPTGVGDEDAARLTEPFRVLLDVLGDGASLTGAGYVRPADVEGIARRTGMTRWWIGRANREDLTWPVADLRATARALGLVSVRKGRIAPTQAARRCAGDPAALLHHIAGRLPLGRSESERQAGWSALAVAGSDTPAELWDSLISGVMFDLGWRDGYDRRSMPTADSLTLRALTFLSGSARHGWRLHGVDGAVAAVARDATRP